MTRRLFWTALGIGFGAVAAVTLARRLRQTREAFTPSRIAGRVGGRVGGVGASFRAFADDVREGMAEREEELHDALGGLGADARDTGPTFERDPGES